MPFPEPLIQLGIYYASGRVPKQLGQELSDKLWTIFDEFIRQATTPEQAATELSQLGLDPKAVLRIQKILETQPAAPETDPKPSREGKTTNPHRQRSSPWSGEEDERLLAGIYHYGTSDWLRVSQFVGNGRTRAQCGQRWLRCLDPNKKKDKWSPDEDTRLINLVEAYGEHAWAKIAKELETRTDVQCRYRYKQHLNHQGLTKASGSNPPAPVIPQNSIYMPRSGAWTMGESLGSVPPPPEELVDESGVKKEDKP